MNSTSRNGWDEIRWYRTFPSASIKKLPCRGWFSKSSNAPNRLKSSSRGSASMGIGNLTPWGLFLRVRVASASSLLTAMVSTFSAFSAVYSLPKIWSCCMQWGHLPPRKKRTSTFLPWLVRSARVHALPVVSVPESGLAGKGDQTSGPSVRCLEVDLHPVAVADAGDAHADDGRLASEFVQGPRLGRAGLVQCARVHDREIPEGMRAQGHRSSHHPVLGPGMAAAELEFLELGGGWQVERLGVVRGIDAVQKGDDVRVGIAQADNLECVSIDVADAQAALADKHPPELPQLRAGALEEFQGLVQASGFVVVGGQRRDGARALPHASIDSPDYLCPASSWRRCQFSRRSCLARKSVSEGLPSRSKCLENRPSLRAKSMKVTGSLVLGLTYQSSLADGLPCRERRSLMVFPLRGS